MSARKPAPDQPQRDAAIAERRRNVLVDAGAGTGKTTILVDRLVEMVAPTGAAPPVRIGQIAAITFTRKAAGELRLRIRERLLQALAEPGLPLPRLRQLRDALAGLDTAYVATIHSFADRLLRLRPVEAELSPAYEIVDDAEDLAHETYELLLHAIEAGTLEAELVGTHAAGRGAEAARIVLFALEVGVAAESRQKHEFYTERGLDALVAGFVNQRDQPPPDVPPAAFDRVAFRAAAEDYIALARGLTGSSRGARWLVDLRAVLERLRRVDEPMEILRELRRQLERTPRPMKKGDTFDGDDAAWKVWKRFDEGDKQHPTPLREALLGPPCRVLATSLARLFPVVTALYEKVKARRQALDQLDLLVKLRDLLRDDLAARADYQRMFDHVFVDEFQDTDPLQAEIVLYLCERAPAARRWDEVELRDGALTLVGDPKQSIYRFRRADVAMYDRVRQVVARRDHLAVTLSANFRSVPPLIQWLNDRFERLLGAPPGGRPFDPDTGRVFHQPLAPGREGAGAPAVRVLAYNFPDVRKRGVDEHRRLEGEALARYLRWLVEGSEVQIADPLDGRARRIRYGDIAVLAITTWSLRLLFPALDAEGIPHASRGGTLFLADPLHRQFLLGLRAIADRDDGVAEAALLRPPFFALDLADLLLARAANGDGPVEERVQRVREARALVAELRRDRLARPPGATARDLLDRTAFARAVALGPNGAQRLARLRELCLTLETLAAAEGLDYDSATARLRSWVSDPVQLDPPHPVATDAVQVLTVHQAKGLEFPVVALWDGKHAWATNGADDAAWRMHRDNRGWLMSLHGLKHEEPTGLGLKEMERAYLDAERRRVVYVAVTRARDVLIVPRASGTPAGRYVCGDLLEGAPEDLIVREPEYRSDCGAAWMLGPATPPTPAAGDVERVVAECWEGAARESARPRFRPASVSGEARGAVAREDEAPEKPRAGRFGHVFGTTVHLAIGMVLRGMTIPEAVRRAAGRTGLTEHIEDAGLDVGRAMAALFGAGLVPEKGAEVWVEYPVAGVRKDGQLLGGYVDLVAVTPDFVHVVDFKTDAAAAGDVEVAFPEYVGQVRSYRGMLAMVEGGRELRPALLFTADGRLHEISATRPARG